MLDTISRPDVAQRIKLSLKKLTRGRMDNLALGQLICWFELKCDNRYSANPHLSTGSDSVNSRRFTSFGLVQTGRVRGLSRDAWTMGAFVRRFLMRLLLSGTNRWGNRYSYGVGEWTYMVGTTRGTFPKHDIVSTVLLPGSDGRTLLVFLKLPCAVRFPIRYCLCLKSQALCLQILPSFSAPITVGFGQTLLKIDKPSEHPAGHAERTQMSE